MRQKLLIVILLFLHTLYAKGLTEKTGDVLTLLIPTVAFGTTLFEGNREDQMEFYKSYGSTIALTHLLKETVREKRPNSESHTSFPSGHTSSAFSGATYIHKKYGLAYATIPYLAAIYTGYSRVHAEKHYTHDVIAGAILGSGLTWYFTRKKEKSISLVPQISADSSAVFLSYKW